MTDTATDTPRFRPWEGLALWLLVWVTGAVAYTALDPKQCGKTDLTMLCDLRRVALYAMLPVFFGIALVLWMRLRHGTGLRALGIGAVTWSAIVTGIGYGLGGRFLSGVTEAATYQITKAIRGAKPKLPEQVELPVKPSGLFWVGVGIAVILLAPIVEEMLFRGLVYLGLRERFGVRAAMVLSSLFFAVTHLYALIIPALFVLAIVLVRLRESRDDLVPVIVAHMTFNAIGFVALILQR